jgi:hypothetical protein
LTILAALRAGQTLTPVDCLALGVTNLAGRAAELQALGLLIEVIERQTPNIAGQLQLMLHVRLAQPVASKEAGK